MEATSLKELKRAIKDKEKTIVVTDKKLVWLLKPLAKAKISSNLNTGMATGALALATGVQITIIVTLGVVVVVSILKGYNVKLRKGDTEIVLEKK